MLEFDPPSRLVLTWGEPGEPAAQRSRVTFLLEQVETAVRLTVTHDELPGSEQLRKIAEGWPRVLSSLKSFLETGTPLPTWAGHRG